MQFDKKSERNLKKHQQNRKRTNQRRGPRVKAIKIVDFKGFAESCMPTIELDGKSLIVCGENGSGKSTIFSALLELLRPTSRNTFDNNFSEIGCLKNRYSLVTAKTGKVCVEFASKDLPTNYPPMTWTIFGSRPTTHEFYAEMSKYSGFLDHRAILLTHFLDFENDHLNLFDIAIKVLLKDVPMSQLQNASTFGVEWQNIQAERIKLINIIDASLRIDDDPGSDFLLSISALGFGREDYIDDPDDDEALAVTTNLTEAYQGFLKRSKQEFLERFEQFFISLAIQLNLISGKANVYLAKFDANLRLVMNASKTPPEIDDVAFKSDTWVHQIRIPLRAEYRGVLLEHPGVILNEARLTAIALSIYLAALKNSEVNSLAADFPRILVLDDVLSGLDMSNRVPILDLVIEEFHSCGWQIIMLTFDQLWYRVAKTRLNNEWQFAELHVICPEGKDVTVLVPDVDHLDRTLEFLNLGQTQAAAVHLRSKFEMVVKAACSDANLKIGFRTDPAKVAAHEFWDAIVSASRDTNNKKISIAADTIKDINHAITYVFNPLNHSEPMSIYGTEISRAINSVRDLHTQLTPSEAVAI